MEQAVSRVRWQRVWGSPAGMRIHIAPQRGPVLVAEPHGPAPVVAVQLWFRTGSAREDDGLHGAAHLLEPRVFKGGGA